MALRWKMFLLAGFCGLASAQTGLTTIQDTLFKADGTLFNGSLTIQWSTFDANNIGTVVQQSETVPVVNGNLLLQLVPNSTAPPPANVYTVQYQSDGREQFAETWTVPASTIPLKVAQVRVGSQIIVPTGNTGTTGGVTGPIPESSITGLQADLAQRPMKGAGFGTNAVATVDDNGMIETVVGDPGDCVFIDGTTGPCGQPTYSDAEVPGGTIDGMNRTFTLAYSPLGSSLALFLNGLYLTANSDYTLNGQTVQFTGPVPQPGDTLIANYRVDTAAGGNINSLVVPGGAIHTLAAQVICSQAGASTNATSWTNLGGCDIPAAGLMSGDRIEVRFTFSHSGSASGFNVQVNWGTTTILSRSGGTQDAAVVGRADAAISSSGAEVSLETWGTVLPFLPGIVSAPAQTALEVTFQAALAHAAPDTLTLTNFTVLRYPGS